MPGLIVNLSEDGILVPLSFVGGQQRRTVELSQRKLGQFSTLLFFFNRNRERISSGFWYETLSDSCTTKNYDKFCMDTAFWDANKQKYNCCT